MLGCSCVDSPCCRPCWQRWFCPRRNSPTHSPCWLLCTRPYDAALDGVGDSYTLYLSGKNNWGCRACVSHDWHRERCCKEGGGMVRRQSRNRTGTHMHSLHPLITFALTFLASGKSNCVKKYAMSGGQLPVPPDWVLLIGSSKFEFEGPGVLASSGSSDPSSPSSRLNSSPPLTVSSSVGAHATFQREWACSLEGGFDDCRTMRERNRETDKTMRCKA